MEMGMLKELNVKPGDVVQSMSENSYFFAAPKEYTIHEDRTIRDDMGKKVDVDKHTHMFRIISRANTTPDLTAITTPFGLLDKATQDALRAHGGPYESYDVRGWHNVSNPSWVVYRVYRVKPQPTVETVDSWLMPSGWITAACNPIGNTPVRVTFTRTNGVIDLDSYKVEAR